MRAKRTSMSARSATRRESMSVRNATRSARSVSNTLIVMTQSYQVAGAASSTAVAHNRAAGGARAHWRSHRSPSWQRSVACRAVGASHRRHDQLLAPAGAAIHLIAIAEAQVLGHADAHFAQPPIVAADRD